MFRAVVIVYVLPAASVYTVAPVLDPRESVAQVKPAVPAKVAVTAALIVKVEEIVKSEFTVSVSVAERVKLLKLIPFVSKVELVLTVTVLLQVTEPERYLKELPAKANAAIVTLPFTTTLLLNVDPE